MLCSQPQHLVMAAVLHDVVEDTDATFADLAARFPPAVVELVRILTQTEYPSKTKAIEAALRHPEAVRIKVADRLDNIRFFYAAPPEKSGSTLR